MQGTREMLSFPHLRQCEESGWLLTLPYSAGDPKYDPKMVHLQCFYSDSRRATDLQLLHHIAAGGNSAP